MGEAISFFDTSDSNMLKTIIVLTGLFFVILLIYSIIFPLLNKSKKTASIQMHPDILGLQNLETPVYKKIAVSFDFSENDIKLLSAAIGKAREDTQFVLIHVVESPTAILLGKETGDYETEKDNERLELFVNHLEGKGYKSKGILGFRHSSKEIVRIVKEENADMLVLGAHGHTGIKDFIYGETVNAVRHEMKIPVLIVHL